MKLLEGKSIEKKANLEKMLSFGTVMVFLDTRRPGVEVPAQHRGNPQLPLNLDYAFQIPDFKILDDRVEASLSFNRQRHFCTIPLTAIYALSSKITGEALVYPDDLPKDISIFDSPEKEDSKKSAEQVESAGHPRFTVISNTDTPELKSKLDDSTKKPPKKGHLKLVE